MEQISHQTPTKAMSDIAMIMNNQDHDQFPNSFIWQKDHVSGENLDEPMIDLQGFFNNDEEATLRAASLIKAACLRHGFFQVINHGVDLSLLASADEHMRSFFKLPITQKLKYAKPDGSMSGYVSAHADRFSELLPWKEMLTFEYHENSSNQVALDFFKNFLGTEFEETGLVYQKYCEATNKLALVILELLGISLGLDQHEYYKELYQDSVSLVRCNYYPTCNKPDLTLGAGPHCDTTTLTVLYQDQVGGLEVFVDNKWRSLPPQPGALVINIGDTFKALSNGRYKSCLHRVQVNNSMPRISMVFFLCPKSDKELKAPQDLVEKDGGRKYPNFTWSDLLSFTQKHHRADDKTLINFTEWFVSSKQISA